MTIALMLQMEQTKTSILQVGWDTLHEEFANLVEKEKKSKQHDEIFDKLKLAVIDYSKSTHNWDGKAEASLVSMTSAFSEESSFRSYPHY